MMSANITTETAAASPMRKYWKPYFSTSKPSTSVELAGPPGSVGSTYCRAKVWNALMEESAATSTAVERNCGRSICQKVRTGPAPSMAAASRNSGGMAASPASQIIMKNGMIWLAGLAAIPPEFREAAAIDGAGPVRTFWHIDLPQLRSTAVLVAALSSINAFQTFALQYVLPTDPGGPANSTLVLGLLVLKYGFQYFRMGDAAAVSVVMFALIMAVTLVQLWFNRHA